MREIVDGVFELGLGFVNVHLVVTDDGVVLVDTGLPRRSKQIERGLHEIRKQIGDVRVVLLTHYHFDHVGNVADLRKRSGARVFAHAADAPVITGAITPPKPSGLLPRLLGRIVTVEPTKIDQLITAEESEPIPGFTAVHTPGHTRGHVSYLLDRAGGVLFAGDTASGSKDGTLVSGPKQVSADPAEQDRSVAKLATHNFEHAVFGHGRAMSGRAVERFREYASALPND
ncbi:glyoxylase-like metal-dependent hydrolase (beta-lactamase superfamily II) [Actinoplanes tereljensis]|uniref:MBL fold hydrolase n=1 Tax=Paractinoplanes tereljensis TaxID=571912 RepID=A0A919P052_9ACTN|nr:MBL fold metallo-hydrolase [Actinoplanes tereljensis]GIF26999.1 MBL fold hydrolase [Actinoplanes tereljensis]